MTNNERGKSVVIESKDKAIRE